MLCFPQERFFMRISAALLLSLPAILPAQQIATVVYNFESRTTGQDRPAGVAETIVAGPDGALWFTDHQYAGPNKIGRITTAGVVTEYPIPYHPESGENGVANGITAGPDGALWFTGPRDRIGRITTAGVITEYPLDRRSNYQPWYITLGPDGALWFTASYPGDYIGRITTAGVVTFYAMPSGFFAGDITAGPDGALWFASGNNIGRITTAGAITEYPVPNPASIADAITVGPDGALWFSASNEIGRITTAGAFTEYPYPSIYPYQNQGPNNGIAKGPDGALWFTMYAGELFRITTEGAFSWYPEGNAISSPSSITTGPDGELWFTMYGGGQLGEAVFVTADLSVNPPSGDYGSGLRFTGSGFTPGENVKIYTSGVGSAVMASATADSSGSFTAPARAPQSVLGPRFFLGAGQSSGKLGAAGFSMNAELILDPDSGTAGSTATAHGYGFGPFETLSVLWDSETAALGSVITDAYGTFRGKAAFTFTIPADASAGANTVTATSTYPQATASAVFTVQ
jgi:virginiamycin B lyase